MQAQVVRHVLAGSVLLATSLCLTSAASASSSAPRLTAAQYRAKATPICEHAKQSLPAPGYAHLTNAAFAAQMTAEATVETSEVHALKQLNPPTSLAPLVQKGLREKMVVIASAEKWASEAKSGSFSLQQAMEDLLKLPNLGPIWREIGAPVCQW